MDYIYKFLEDLKLSDESSLVAAVSYGPDSMALLHMLKQHFKNNKIVCAHVHHNHREESDQEAKELEKYCKDNSIIFEMMLIDKYDNDKFTEKQAREIRYDFFEKLIKKYNSNYLFTAHHGDDLVETILMRLVRGSSFKGYAGIPLVSNRNNYKMVRPFLYVTKQDLMNYCLEYKLPYANDPTNTEDDYTRNRFRKQVLPFLKKENACVHEQFLKFSKVLTSYQEHVDKEAAATYDNVILDGSIKINELIKYDELIIRLVLQKFLLNEYGKEISNLNDSHINIILNILNDNKPNLMISLPCKKKLVKAYDNLYFDKHDGYNDYCFIFDGYVTLSNNYYIKQTDNIENTSNYTTALLSTEISLPIYVRNKLDGDVIEVLGMNGTRKIKKVLSDEKIPKNERVGYPVVVDSTGKVLWLPGLKKSKYDKSKSGNYDIILTYHKEEKDDTAK